MPRIEPGTLCCWHVTNQELPSLGPRICIGQQFALTEMAYTVVRILQTYESLECKSEEFPGLKSDIVLQPARGVKVAFHKPCQEKR